MEIILIDFWWLLYANLTSFSSVVLFSSFLQTTKYYLCSHDFNLTSSAIIIRKHHLYDVYPTFSPGLSHRLFDSWIRIARTRRWRHVSPSSLAYPKTKDLPTFPRSSHATEAIHWPPRTGFSQPGPTREKNSTSPIVSSTRNHSLA